MNPIFQNKLHTKALSSVIGDDYTIYSVIVFSERCTLKKVSVSDNRIKVINRSYLNYAIQELSLLTTNYITQSKVDDIYNLLYPYSQVTEEIKAKHIDDIKINHIINQNVDKNDVVEDIMEKAITDNQENETA
ncbi:MAG: hypothetical protein SPI53_01130 [Erysipelotrichaceae bacterium]|nr:hypothetical protein [Erysipelotrichaceae bacterium]